MNKSKNLSFNATRPHQPSCQMQTLLPSHYETKNTKQKTHSTLPYQRLQACGVLTNKNLQKHPNLKREIKQFDKIAHPFLLEYDHFQ
jgi:hypothetical protein